MESEKWEGNGFSWNCQRKNKEARRGGIETESRLKTASRKNSGEPFLTWMGSIILLWRGLKGPMKVVLRNGVSIRRREFHFDTRTSGGDRFETIVSPNILQPIYGIIPAGFDFSDTCIQPTAYWVCHCVRAQHVRELVNTYYKVLQSSHTFQSKHIHYHLQKIECRVSHYLHSYVYYKKWYRTHQIPYRTTVDTKLSLLFYYYMCSSFINKSLLINYRVLF